MAPVIDWSKPITYRGNPAEYVCQHKGKRVVATCGTYDAFNEDGTYGGVQSGVQHIQNVPPPKKKVWVLHYRMNRGSNDVHSGTFSTEHAALATRREQEKGGRFIAMTEIAFDEL